MGEAVCDYVTFNANMNISNIDDDCHFHHYGGNITMTIIPNNAHTTENVTPNDVFNGTITTSLDMCRNRFIFNLTSCDDCGVFGLKGFYQVGGTNSNSTCTQFSIEAFAPQH